MKNNKQWIDNRNVNNGDENCKYYIGFVWLNQHFVRKESQRVQIRNTLTQSEIPLRLTFKFGKK